MKITANNPNRKSWINVKENSDFPIQNIPFGVFITKDDIITIGTRIGDFAIDLGALHQLGYFEGIPLTDDIFLQDTLNDFIADGRKTWRLVRNRIADVFDVTNGKLRDNVTHKDEIIFRMEDVEMQLPVAVGDYTDFYASKEHATNVGSLFVIQKMHYYQTGCTYQLVIMVEVLLLFHQELLFVVQLVNNDQVKVKLNLTLDLQNY